MFVNLKDTRVFCLPDNYQVEDASLNDIKYNLAPVYTKEIINKLDTEPIFARGLDGTEFYPGCVGLNNLKQTDFVNVVLQSLCRVKPLRDFYLL
jgi:U4/U6.U5 tri-snRNP-associated protein 2